MIDVNKVAHLARLAIAPGEEKKYQEQLTSIFKYFEEISTLDTKGIEPLVTPSEIAVQFREDVVQHPITVEEAMQNAPERSGNLFKVPPVV